MKIYIEENQIHYDEPSRRINYQRRTIYDPLWKTHKGELISPCDMATPHLINAVNMIWRNIFRIKEDHPEINRDWECGYIKRALDELTKEIQKRADKLLT